MNLSHHPYQEAFRPIILEIWEASVRATHSFLKEEDILFYKTLVRELGFPLLNTHLVATDQNEWIGFWGTSERELIMLFLAPAWMGKGLGKQILQHIKAVHDIHTLEVNEQNLGAVAFYTKLGFEVIERRPIDDHGKPYPILKMRLKNS
ncbi:MAG TPA: GNAT family N-acetyltransferase [Phnomibacter sp.]|nr:GNAT family N-acetyltransferase [Phnomibacter sp.]